jgi:hypothetical protein
MVITHMNHIARVEGVAGKCAHLHLKMVVDGTMQDWISYKEEMSKA